MKKNIVLVTGATLAASTGLALAGSVTQNLDGIHSWESLGDALNHQLTFNIGAGSHVVGVSWVDVEGEGLDAAGNPGGPSWGNEMSMAIGHTGDPAAWDMKFFPAEGSASAGGPWGPISGAADLLGDGDDFVVGGDGVLTMEFFESYNDHTAGADAHYIGGSVVVEYNAIPAPGALALLGLAGIAGTRRRRA